MIINGEKITIGNNDMEGVYVVTVRDVDTTYCYIGSGKLADRVSGNKSKLKRNKHDNKKLQEAYNRVKECEVTVIDFCGNKEEAREMESKVIEYAKGLDGVVVCNKNKTYVDKDYVKRLNKDDVVEIKKMLRDDIDIKDIAKAYGVSKELIYNIKSGYRWSSVVV